MYKAPLIIALLFTTELLFIDFTSVLDRAVLKLLIIGFPFWIGDSWRVQTTLQLCLPLRSRTKPT